MERNRKMSTWNSRLGLETLGSRQIENAQKSPRTLVSIQKSQIPCYACDWWRTRWNRDELSNLLLCSLVLETPYPQIPHVSIHTHIFEPQRISGAFSGIVIRDPRICKSNRFQCWHLSVFLDWFEAWLPEYIEYVVYVPRIFHIHTDFSYF